MCDFLLEMLFLCLAVEVLWCVFGFSDVFFWCCIRCLALLVSAAILVSPFSLLWRQWQRAELFSWRLARIPLGAIARSLLASG